jgi:hypothetical protein
MTVQDKIRSKSAQDCLEAFTQSLHTQVTQRLQIAASVSRVHVLEPYDGSCGSVSDDSESHENSESHEDETEHVMIQSPHCPDTCTNFKWMQHTEESHNVDNDGAGSTVSSTDWLVSPVEYENGCMVPHTIFCTDADQHLVSTLICIRVMIFVFHKKKPP